MRRILKNFLVGMALSIPLFLIFPVDLVAGLTWILLLAGVSGIVTHEQYLEADRRERCKNVQR